MSKALAERTEAQGLAKILITHERRKSPDKKAALRSVARSIGVSPGTMENITRARRKTIGGWLRDALRARVVRELELEIVRLQHEIAVLKQVGMDPRSNEIAAVHADLSAVFAALGRDRPEKGRR